MVFSTINKNLFKLSDIHIEAVVIPLSFSVATFAVNNILIHN